MKCNTNLENINIILIILIICLLIYYLVNKRENFENGTKHNKHHNHLHIHKNNDITNTNHRHLQDNLECKASQMEQCDSEAEKLGKTMKIMNKRNGAPAGCIKNDDDDEIEWVKNCENHVNCGTNNCNGCEVLFLKDAVPTTGVPTTGGPTTGVPTTGVPTTGVPTTGGPTTGGPTTGVPTTGVPTTV
jgi:hypothetical protein